MFFVACCFKLVFTLAIVVFGPLCLSAFAAFGPFAARLQLEGLSLMVVPQAKLVDQVVSSLLEGELLIVTYGNEDSYSWEPDLNGAYINAKRFFNRDPADREGREKRRSGMHPALRESMPSSELSAAAESVKTAALGVRGTPRVLKCFCKRGLHRSVAAALEGARLLQQLGFNVTLLNLGLAARWWPLDAEKLVHFRADGTCIVSRAQTGNALRTRTQELHPIVDVHHACGRAVANMYFLCTH